MCLGIGVAIAWENAQVGLLQVLADVDGMHAVQGKYFQLMICIWMFVNPC